MKEPTLAEFLADAERYHNWRVLEHHENFLKRREAEEKKRLAELRHRARGDS